MGHAGHAAAPDVATWWSPPAPRGAGTRVGRGRRQRAGRAGPGGAGGPGSPPFLHLRPSPPAPSPCLHALRRRSAEIDEGVVGAGEPEAQPSHRLGGCQSAIVALLQSPSVAERERREKRRFEALGDFAPERNRAAFSRTSPGVANISVNTTCRWERGLYSNAARVALSGTMRGTIAVWEQPCIQRAAEKNNFFLLKIIISCQVRWHLQNIC